MPPEATTAPQVQPDADTTALADAISERVGPKLDEKLTPITTSVEEVKAENAKLAEELAQIRHEMQQKAGSSQFDLPGWETPEDPSDPNRLSLARLVLGHMDKWGPRTKNWKREYEYANELPAQVKITGQQVGIGESGGLLVAPMHMPGIVEALEANSMGEQIAGNVLTNLSGGSIVFNRAVGGTVAYWKGEGAPTTTTSETFDAFELRPIECAAVSQTSKKQLAQDGGAMTNYLEKRQGKHLGLALDRGLFFGTGSGQPLGIFNMTAASNGTTDFSSIDFGGADQTVTASLNDMVVKMQNREAFFGAGDPLWISTPAGFADFRNALDADGKPLGLFSMPIAGDANPVSQQDRLMGYRYAMGATSQGFIYGAANSTFALLMTDALYIAKWGVIEITPSEHAGTAFANNDMLLRSVMYADTGMIRNDYLQTAASWTTS